MGSFIYDRSAAIDIDDRALTHLQVVILDKLRGNESFAFDLWNSTHWCTMWVSRRTPLEFVYSGNRRVWLNREWLEEMADEVGIHGTLRLIPEPIPAYQGEPGPRVEPVPAPAPWREPVPTT